MFSDIYGEKKREIFLLISNLLKNKNVIGFLYGREGIGKKFIVKKAISQVASEKDISVIIENPENWKKKILEGLGIKTSNHISNEEFILNLLNFLEKNSGRVFIIIDKINRLSETQILEIIHLLSIKEKISTFLIGNEETKEKINPFNLGKAELSINFNFYVEPPEYTEFERYFIEKYGSKTERKAIKILYRQTKGSIGKAEEEILKHGRLPLKVRDLKKRSINKTFLILSGFLILFISGMSMYFAKKEDYLKKEKKIIIVDKKLPEEGNILQDLPVKPKKKSFKINWLLSEIDREINSIKLEDIPPVNYFTFKYRVQIAAFKNLENANRLKTALEKEFNKIEVIKSKKGYNLVVINAESKEKAFKIKKNLEKKGFKPVVRRIK